jgi:competence protein ComEC
MRSARPPAVVVLGVALLATLALAHRDAIRSRAEDALGRGMPAREAELARGFVLGEDEDLDARTVEDFRRAGLSHLLAVSGQNVALLALLAMPVLGAFGIPLRARLIWILAAIAVYVPLAGAGPSIVRAGVMGTLSVLAMLAGRPVSRLYALAVAATVTLAIDPSVGADIGWQLSFAAVLGIVAVGSPLRRAIAAAIGDGGWRGVLAEGAALTIAATLATAPLVAFHFEALSTTTLVANLLVLPAVAPAMWLGMLTAGAGQVPGFPVAALNAVAAPLLAYIAQIAAWCGAPSWAYLHVRLDAAGLIACYLGLGLAAIAVLRLPLRRPPRARLGAAAAAAAVLVAVALVSAAGEGGASATEAPPTAGLRIEVLDVGQGDAILLQPADAPAVLVDGGPPGDELAAKLRAAGVERLGLAVVTHEQSDHAGGIEELLGRFPVAHLAFARIGRRLFAETRLAGIRPLRLAQGGRLRSGRLQIEALWPPRALLAGPLGTANPNTQALVLLARWHDFSMLLTADAEAESTPVESGPVDVLKVAHHGSDDAGLDGLLDRVSPKLAVISVGAGNPYGHPTQRTLSTLAAHGVQTLRTDLDGTIVLDVSRSMVKVLTGI